MKNFDRLASQPAFKMAVCHETSFFRIIRLKIELDMERLKDGWLTEGLIDFEYKKYQLMAYFKHVKESFNRVELYPFLSDLVFHYRNLFR
jgi:hypothetical protein